MEPRALKKLTPTKSILNPSQYVLAIDGEFKDFAFDEEEVLAFKGCWRAKAFDSDSEVPLDLEIGTGNGFHFANHAFRNPQRLVVGLEIKFKPLIQSIRRALNFGCKNARVARFHATELTKLFSENEINDVFIHFPDPWEKRKQNKHRLIQTQFLESLFKMQNSGSQLEFKTDHKDYFRHSLKVFKKGPYRVDGFSEDLHHSPFAEANFETHFEKIFLRKGQPIYFARLIKD